MSIASEITRLQGVKSDILQAISDKGVTVPVGSALDDCPDLITSISGGGSFGADNIVNIVPIDKMVVVDSNGYIGYDLTNYFQYRGSTYYYNYAILSPGDDFSNMGLGQVTFYTPASDNIGGRVYNTVIIGGKEWMAENLDFKFSGCAIGQSGSSTTEPRANYYNDDEATYGVNGNKYGLLYNYSAVEYLETNKTDLIPGWHVPTKDEWTALATAVGGINVAGTKLKSTTGWASGNGDDSYGFSAFPSGRMESGRFNGLGERALFWTPTLSGANPYSIFLFYSYTKITFEAYGGNLGDQYSVRLVKDIQ